MAAKLTKPLVVPQFGNGSTVDPDGGLIKLFSPDPITGLPVPNPGWTIDLQAIFDNDLFPGAGRVACPNCCKLLGPDLFVALSSTSSQAVLKLPNYLANPAAAKAAAFVFTLDGNDYVGLAFDRAAVPNLYAAEGSFADNHIIRYGGTDVLNPASRTSDTYTGRADLGNAGLTSYFANLVFDSAGNLWATDAANNRLVVWDALGLANGTFTYHVLGNKTGTIAFANTDPALNTPITALFAQPEGIDVDAFAATANLWVANNNDGSYNGVTTNATTLVKITPALQTLVLATPAGATLDPAMIVPNTNCFVYQVPVGTGGRPQFGGLQVDKAAHRIVVNEEHGLTARAFDIATIAATPATATDSILPGVVSTAVGNGGIALIGLGAFIPDTEFPPGSPIDLGFEPNTVSANLWQSASFSVVQNSLGAQNTLPPNQDVTGGQPCVIYVQIENFDNASTSGTELLEIRWAKGGMALGWPAPWDGSLPMGAIPTGGLAGTGMIPKIPAFGQAVVGPITWLGGAPDPSLYADGHFCLLARVLNTGLVGQGISAAQTNDAGAYARANARVAWRNIHIINPKTGLIVHRAGVVASNYTAAPITVRIQFELLDGNAAAVPRPSGTVTIDATGLDRTALSHTSLAPVWTPTGPVALPSIAAGIDGLNLAPGQSVRFIVDYGAVGRQAAPAATEGADAGYVLVVSQWDTTTATPRQMGGQSFVAGTVAGFPIHALPPGPKPRPPRPPGVPAWLWWLLLVFILSRCAG